MLTLIKNASIVNEGKIFISDLLIEDERIKQISEKINVNPDIETLDDDRVLIEDDNDIDPTSDAGIKPIEDDKEEL